MNTNENTTEWARFEEQLALHRYFLYSSEMRERFMRLRSAMTEDNDAMEMALIPVIGPLYLGLHYATLFVVVEGWKDIQLQDEAVEELLEHGDHIDRLRRFRNGVFHYQSRYWDPRFTDVWQSREFLPWVQELFRSLRAYFERWARTISPEGWESAERLAQAILARSTELEYPDSPFE